MWRTIPLRFASDHPTAAGHFPSNPIIPGALLLDAVLDALRESAHLDGEVTVLAAKFFRPVRPGEALRVQWQFHAGSTVRFECLLDGHGDRVAFGTLAFGQAPR